MARATSAKQLGRLLDRVWPKHEVVKQGEEHMVSCPFCASTKHKLAINPNKGVFQCWVCGERGPTAKLLEHLYKLNIIKQSDIEAVVYGRGGATKLSSEIAAYAAPEPPKEVQYWSETIPCVYPKGVISFSSNTGLGKMEVKVRDITLKYLHGRGLLMDDIIRYNLSYCTKFGSPYHGHVFFPALGRYGREMVFWTTRATFPGSEPKSLHAGKKYSRFSAKQILFNEHLVVDTTVAVCEGPFDAHSILAYTAIPACPLLGKIMHQYHLDRLSEKGIKVVYLCLDPDAVNFQEKLAWRFERKGVKVLHVKLEDGDPNDISPEKLKAAFDEAASEIINPLKLVRKL